jgi:hypothetical protein
VDKGEGWGGAASPDWLPPKECDESTSNDVLFREGVGLSEKTRLIIMHFGFPIHAYHFFSDLK